MRYSIIILIILTVPSLSFSATIVVPDDQPTIQAAIDAFDALRVRRCARDPTLEGPAVRELQPIGGSAIGGRGQLRDGQRRGQLGVHDRDQRREIIPEHAAGIKQHAKHRWSASHAGIAKRGP